MKLQEIMNNKKKYNFVDISDQTIYCPRLPSGIYPLDHILAGGLPIGHTSCIYGPPGGAKTTLSYKFMASAQNLCFRCFNYKWACTCEEGPLEKSVVFVSVEGSADIEWAKSMGVDIDKLIIVEPLTGEETVDVVYECMLADDCGLIVLDSIGRVVPEKEITDSAMQLQVGSKAKLLTRLSNKVKSALMQNKKEKRSSLFLAVNQVRANIGSMYGPTETVPGGYALSHDWTLTIRQSQLKSDNIDKQTELPITGRFKSNIISPNGKRKLFTLAGTAEYYVQMKAVENPVGTVLDHKTLYKYADQVGLIDKNRWSSTFDELKFGSKNEMMQYWKENPEYLLQLKKNVVQYYCDAERGLIGAEDGSTDDMSEMQQADDAQ